MPAYTETFAPTEPPLCPWCREPQEQPARDYVVPGRVGLPSRAGDYCVGCDKPFFAMVVEDGRIQVTTS